MAKGLYMQTSWTWARDRYDMDYNWDLDNSAFTSENPFDRHREVGVAPDVPTHRFTTNYVYQLPFGRGRHFLSGSSKLLNLAAGGWELAGVFTTQTGYFLTPIIGPGVNIWHMGLAKEFFLTEKGARLRWDLTATNIFNHPTGSPGTDMTDPTGFGVITDANGVTNASAGDQTGARFALAVISVGQTIAFGGLSASLL